MIILTVKETNTRGPQLEIRDLQSPIRNRKTYIPHSEIRIPHSKSFRIPHSALRIPKSAFRNPHSEIRIPHSPFRIPMCLLLSAFCLLLFGCSNSRGPGPLSPQEALKSFRLSDPNLRVELFAAEPYVVDPVELVFDEDGRAFVAEMRDYPEDPPPGQPPKSRIRLLEDTDGDGRIDHSTIFADNLLQVTSMLPWKGGLIVTAAPDILYLKDTDGDKKADVRKVLFTGFALVNPESRITNLRFGVDNWIYAANHGQPGTITFPGRDMFLDRNSFQSRDRQRPDIPTPDQGTTAQQPRTVSVLGADFRFRLDRGLFEAESGPTQFGLTMDDWGHRFITENTIHVRHVVMPRRYLNRNPFLAAGPAAEDISDHGRPSARMFNLTPPQYWRQVRTAMRQQRYRENNLNRNEIVAGFFTAASGGTIYSGDTLFEEYYGNLFTGDVSGNLIHRDILRPVGASFTASRAGNELNSEFLASTDPWFRPCNFTTGPDGSLYVVDIYREFIETPESIPEELKKNMDFYSGTTMGRIYRIVPKNVTQASGRQSGPYEPQAPGSPPGRPEAGATTGATRPNLSKTPTSDLVPLLSHSNGWWRLTAQRLLLERQDKSVVPALRKIVEQSDFPQARLHALYALEGLSSLDEALIERALKDPHPGVREHGLQLAESYLGAVEMRDLTTLQKMAQDPSPRVRFQLALTLGSFGDEMVALRPSSARREPAGARRYQNIVNALATLASEQAQDPWFRMAILSSGLGSSVRLLEALLRQEFNSVETPARSVSTKAPQRRVSTGNFFQKPESGREKFLEQVAAVIGARNEKDEISRFLNLLSALKGHQGPSGNATSRLSTNHIGESWHVAGLSGLARGLKLAQAQRLKLPAAEAQLTRFLSDPSEKVQSAARAVARHFEMRTLISASIKQAVDTTLPHAKRKIAIQSLASGTFSDVRPVFEKLLSLQPNQDLLEATVTSLNALDDPGVAYLLISNWKLFGPVIRNQTLDVLLNHRQRVPALLEAIENGRIERNALDLPRREKLLENPDPKLAGRARQLFKHEPNDRAKAVESYRSALALTGDTIRGRVVFEKNCAVCHMPQKGRRIGPDLSGVSSQTREQLLQNILDPSREIQPRLTNYIVTTKDGRIHDGLIASETPGAITLRPATEEDETILRRNVSEIRASSVSLMPEGLEKNMTKQDLADLIGFLQGAGLHHHGP